MRKSVLRIGTILTLALASAAIAAEAQTAQTELVKGTVISRVECRESPGFSYALYLPSSYSPDKKWPVVFGFSPGGVGEQPVNLLKAAAEKYGYIVVGSNDAKNGPIEPIQKAQKAMWKEVTSRFPVAEGRCYSVGFSGGARAGLVLALQHPEAFAGAICCGAFYPETEEFKKGSKLAVCLIVGSQDFNLFEMLRGADFLREKGMSFWFEEFVGPHQWPAQALGTNALEFLHAVAMQRGLIPKDQAFLDAQAEARLAEAAALDSPGTRPRAWRTYALVAREFKDTPAAAKAAERAAQLAETPEVKERLVLEARFKKYNEEIPKLSSPQDLIDMVNELRKEVAAGGPGAVPAGQLLQLLALQLTQIGDGAYRQKQFLQAAASYSVASEIQPQNFLAPYNAACCYALAGKKNDAIRMLERSVDAGLKDAKLLRTDRDLDDVRKDPRFPPLLARVEAAGKAP